MVSAMQSWAGNVNHRLQVTRIAKNTWLGTCTENSQRKVNIMTGEELKQLRRDLRMTQAELANLLGVNRESVACMEADKYKIKGAMLKLLERIRAEG